MNSYITIDSKKYRTPFKKWKPVVSKPATVRYTFDDAIDVTYGPGNPRRWEGAIRAQVTPDSGYGSVDELRASLAYKGGISFVDHYGTSYTVHVVGDIIEDSFSPMWDGASNEMDFVVRLRL